MKHTYRNMIIALGLATSLVLPGLAMADNWNPSARQYSPKQYPSQQQGAYRGHDGYRGREVARRDGYAGHEWREHQRWQRFDHDAHEWREHTHRYVEPPYYYGYRVYPSAIVSGIYFAPTPRLVIDLR
jgi:hypothetical protein